MISAWTNLSGSFEKRFPGSAKLYSTSHLLSPADLASNAVAPVAQSPQLTQSNRYILALARTCLFAILGRIWDATPAVSMLSVIEIRNKSIVFLRCSEYNGVRFDLIRSTVDLPCQVKLKMVNFWGEIVNNFVYTYL